jgi:multiple sugar transport system substrate-binding protein
MLRKSVLVLLLIALCTSAVSAQRTIVHYVYLGSGLMKTLEGLAEKFEAQNPGVNIEFIGAASDTEFVDKLSTMIAGGQTPDIIEAYFSLAQPYLKAGLLEDLRPWFDRDRSISTSDFIPAAIAGNSTADGMIWGFPWRMWILHPIYNETMFLQAGLELPSANPGAWTWSRLREYGQKLTRRSGDGTVETWGMGIWPYIGRDEVFVVQAGGTFWDPKNPTRGLWLSEPVRTGLGFMVDMHKQGIVKASGIDGGPSFTQGKVGMELGGGNFSVGGYVNANLPFDWGIAPWPRGPVNDGSLFGTSSWQIMRDSKNKELAWEWLKFVLFSEEGARAVMRDSGVISAVIKHIASWPKLFPGQSPTFQIMPALFANPANYSPGDFPRRNDVQNKYNSEIVVVLRGQKPLEIALVAVDEYMKAAVMQGEQQ